MKIIKPSELENRKPPADFIQRVETAVNSHLEENASDIHNIPKMEINKSDLKLWEKWKKWLIQEFFASGWVVAIKTEHDQRDGDFGYATFQKPTNVTSQNYRD